MSYSPNTIAQKPTLVQTALQVLQCGFGVWGECESFSVAGVAQVFLLLRESLGRVYRDSYGLISGFEDATFNEWVYLPLASGAGSVETTTEIAATGTRFVSVLSGSRAQMDEVKWRAVKTLLSRRPYLLIEDENGVYWLIGQTVPARLTTAVYSSGSVGGDFGGLTFEFQSQDFCQPVRLAQSAIDELVFDLSANCGDYAQSLTLAALSKCQLSTYNTIVT